MLSQGSGRVQLGGSFDGGRRIENPFGDITEMMHAKTRNCPLVATPAAM
jgi:hypothetical protein